jgi:hypothetical protein
MMHGRKKSYPGRINRSDPSRSRWTGTNGNASRQSTHRAQNRASVSQASERIRKPATALRRQTPKVVGAVCLKLGTCGSVRGGGAHQ